MRNGKVKSFSKQALSRVNATNPIVSIDSIIDSNISEEGWLSDYSLKYWYQEGMICRYIFKSNKIPVRVEVLYNTLYEDLITYMKSTLKLKLVSSSKVKMVVKLFVKNLSRCKHHKINCFTYLRNKKYWKDFKNLSNVYFIYLLDMLEIKGYVKSFKGFMTDDSNIKSLLLIHSNLMEFLEGEPEKDYDDLLPPKQEQVIIKKDKYTTRKPTKLERPQVKKLDNILSLYNEQLDGRTVTVNGVDIPELFFRRVFNEDLTTGGRFYDNGDGIQRKSKEDRSTTLIDGEPTVGLDFKSLHPNMAAELLGVKLTHDPYQSKDLDLLFTLDHEVLGNNPDHNPVRNFCKKALLTMINSKDTLEASRSLSQDIAKDRGKPEEFQKYLGIVGKIPVAKVVSGLMEHNKVIAEYLCSKKGTYFQFLDSQIMNYCIERHLEIDEVMIPIHDCCIVREGIKNFTVKVMTEGYKHVLGSARNCTIEEE